MIKIITDKKRITQLHKKFHKRLNELLTKKVDCWVGYPSGSFEDTVKYSDLLNIWISHNEQPSRYWNGFGIGAPIEGKNNSLNGEINFPYEGINRTIAGAFGVEDTGNILVLHRGKIGGGKLGIGKNYFTDNFRGDFVTVIDNDRETQFCLVGDLNSMFFPSQVANFINEIYRVKNLEVGETSADFRDLINFNFTDESSGTTTSECSISSIERIHGIIVNKLAIELERSKYKVGNDKNRDLFIHKNGKIQTLFEIKTSISSQNLYSAVGQLIVYSIPIKNPVNLVLVIPEKLNKIVTNRFLQLGIKILYFKWIDDKPNFIRLDHILD